MIIKEIWILAAESARCVPCLCVCVDGELLSVGICELKDEDDFKVIEFLCLDDDSSRILFLK